MYFIGIDWADQKHDVCIMAEDGRVLSEFVIQHSWVGFEHLQRILGELSPIEINLERADGLLIDWLIRQGWAIYIMPPQMVAKRRPRRSKDDRGDAYLLANLRRLKDPDSRPLVIHSEIIEELRQLTRAYEQLQKQQLNASNQLRQVLKHYYPAAVRLFTHVHAPVTLAFLQAYSTPEAARQVSCEELDAFLRAHRYPYVRRVPNLHAELQKPAPTARVATGHEQHMLALVALLQTLQAQLHQTKQRISEVFKTHPEAAWWQAFPGAGILTAARLLARMGDNRDQFPTVQSLQATAGTVPVTRRSGKQLSVRFRWACSHPLRDTVMNLARNSVRQSGWARSYYHDQLSRGHGQSRAYRALANRWLKIIWTLWQRRETYSEALHVANRSRRGHSKQVA